MSITLEALQQQILATSGDLLGNIGSSGYHLSPDAIAQLLRSSQDYLHNDNLPPLSSSSNVQYLGELFHNSQVFKGFPEGAYSYLNSSNKNIEELDRGVVGNAPPSADNSKFLKWMNTMDEYQQNADYNRSKMNCSSDQSIPPTPSPYSPEESMTPPYTGVNGSSSGIGVVPTMNAQGMIIDEGKSAPGPDPTKKRKPEETMDTERLVKKKRRQEKNREAAQLFRQRQKAKVHELEKSVDELTCNNSEFRMKLEILAFENKILKDQLFYLKNLVSSGILITSVPGGPTFSPISMVPAPLEKPEITNLLMGANNSAPHVVPTTSATSTSCPPQSPNAPAPMSTCSSSVSQTAPIPLPISINKPVVNPTLPATSLPAQNTPLPPTMASTSPSTTTTLSTNNKEDLKKSPSL